MQDSAIDRSSCKTQQRNCGAVGPGGEWKRGRTVPATSQRRHDPTAILGYPPNEPPRSLDLFTAGPLKTNHLFPIPKNPPTPSAIPGSEDQSYVPQSRCSPSRPRRPEQRLPVPARFSFAPPAALKIVFCTNEATLCFTYK